MHICMTQPWSINSSSIGQNGWLIWTIWTLLSTVPRKAVKLNGHNFTDDTQMHVNEWNVLYFNSNFTEVFFSCDQAALWMVFSVRLSVCLSVGLSVRPSVPPSVCLSVCHILLTMFPSSYHHEIFRCYYQWQKWCPCKRSSSEVKGQGHRGHNPT